MTPERMKAIQQRLDEITDYPARHQHSFVDLLACCTVNGVLDLNLLETHKACVPQRNPSKCDVLSGPCSCGAWH